MLIYANSPVSRWHVFTAGLRCTTDIDLFNTSDGPKIAVLHIPFPWDHGPGQQLENIINQILDSSDKIAILCSELHGSTVDFILKYRDPKIKYFICGVVDGVDSTPWMDWFTTSSFFYKNNPGVLTALTPYQTKPKVFDILLGQPKPHRDSVYRYINDNKFQDRVIMTYLHGRNQTIPVNDTAEFIWEEDGVELIETDVKWTVTPVKYHGQDMSLSQVVPIKIYNQTAYSIICETCFDNYFTFFTEKTVKPILAERLFIAFAGQYFLRNLRDHGFQTFDGIIDESYDSIDDNVKRWKRAREQMRYLFDQPQEEILAKIRPITEYNKQVMLSTEWSADYFKLLREFLLS